MAKKLSKIALEDVIYDVFRSSVKRLGLSFSINVLFCAYLEQPPPSNAFERSQENLHKEIEQKFSKLLKLARELERIK